MTKRTSPPSLFPVEFGRREDGSTWIAFGPAGADRPVVIWPGPLSQAGDVAQAMNALGLAKRALEAARTDARDPDTDTALAPATGDLIDEALAALGGIR